MTGPLTGVKILDFTQLLQGPYATQILGDMGADVIKLEPPKGDWMRSFALGNLYLSGESASFLAFNRNKRSACINLKDPDGVEAIKRLVAQADVVIENFRPDVMDRLGIGYETLKLINPKIIYCAASGWGRTGPYAKRPGQDLLVQAMTGLPYLNGRDEDPPIGVGIGIADIAGSFHMVYGVLAALFSRERSGRGQRVDVSLFNSLLSFVNQEFSIYLNGGGSPSRNSSAVNPAPYNGAPYGMYPTADGFIAIAMNALNKLGKSIGMDKYRDVSSNNVMEDRDAIVAELQTVFRQKPTDAWMEILLADDIWCAPVNTFADLEADPQINHNNMIVEIDHPKAGPFRTLGFPLEFSETASDIRMPAPLLGQHTREILEEVADY